MNDQQGRSVRVLQAAQLAGNNMGGQIRPLKESVQKASGGHRHLQSRPDLKTKGKTRPKHKQQDWCSK